MKTTEATTMAMRMPAPGKKIGSLSMPDTYHSVVSAARKKD